MSNASVEEPRHSPGVEAALQFLVASGKKPRTYAFDPPGGAPRSNARYVPRRVAIQDARRHAAAFALDREGFAFVQHASAVRDFWSEDRSAGSITPKPNG